MKFKFRKRLKKTFAVCCAVLVVVCSMAFSASADEVLFNGTLTFDDEKGLYLFPSIISLTVGDFYSLTYNGETISSVVNAPLEDMAGPYVVFSDIAMLTTVDFGDGDRTVLVWLAEEPPATIDIILSKGASGGQSEDQVVFDGNVQFEKLAGSYVGGIENPSFTFIIGSEYEVSVNGIKRVYTAEMFDDGSGIYIGPVPVVDGEIVAGIGPFFGSDGFIINADNLLPGEGTYPVKITLLGIKGPSFLGSVTDAIGSVLSWVGIPINEMLNDGGALTALLPLFGIGIAIAAVFVGIKIIRSFIWSA